MYIRVILSLSVAGTLYSLLSHLSVYSVSYLQFGAFFHRAFVRSCSLLSPKRSKSLFAVDQMPARVAVCCKNMQQNNILKFEKKIFQSEFGIRKAVLFYKIVY